MAKKIECEHMDWEIQGADLIGFGRCQDCGKRVKLSELFNNLKDRMEKALDAIEKERKRFGCGKS